MPKAGLAICTLITGADVTAASVTAADEDADANADEDEDSDADADADADEDEDADADEDDGKKVALEEAPPMPATPRRRDARSRGRSVSAHDQTRN